MRYNTRDHTIHLKCGRDFNHKWGEVRSGRGGVYPWSGADSGNFDVVCPCDEEGGVVLPVECALEEVRAGAIRWSVDVCYSCLRYCVVNLDALNAHSVLMAGQKLSQMKHLPDRSPKQSTVISI